MVKLALIMPYNLASLNWKGESSLANFVRQVVDHITSMLKFWGVKGYPLNFFIGHLNVGMTLSGYPLEVIYHSRRNFNDKS